eukprot:CAMPEP_0182808636 /NCGR_PEP_ID=MMETSP0006_2-20121128/6756_1 /TAXON_ID=97485 /ORGANISM="Prymnesium parvum, Strain Texoma1" /LENGTH=79 /DNA_ID=CAMNT_0024934367 /DNA_START=323 /DNA_END=560 /DNA_ORIENTATION=-
MVPRTRVHRRRHALSHTAGLETSGFPFALFALAAGFDGAARLQAAFARASAAAAAALRASASRADERSRSSACDLIAGW